MCRQMLEDELLKLGFILGSPAALAWIYRKYADTEGNLQVRFRGGVTDQLRPIALFSLILGQ